MYLAKNLKYLRLKNGFSQDYLADKLGYKSYTTIQKWEMGTSEPSLGILNKLSELYNVDMHTLYSIDLEGSNNSDNENTNRIPLLGTIAAGLPILAEENIEDYFYIDKSIKADFALRIKGDSMLRAGIFPNDIVFIKKQEMLENGEIGAILIENEATLKKFYRNNGTVVLQPENDKYQPIILTNGNVKILGKLVAVLNIRD
ncbi:MAG: repressor LexA [Tepidanaerobacter acetatoxydans]|uniref:transcriptional repressor LexA n=1 Tax=Tepidanaerobacter acetatoxydans TaxID=499229 RepID=UPI0026F23DA0|nr:transcriptional repressor LexA [Tepidanaerobacter acetatoxydans]NLU09405.1 repressor LexA [Tepidanaerobacter acetatoxydans]